VAAADANPLARRYELAAQLRQLRLDAGLSIEEVAAELMCSPAKISRLETAGRGIQPRDVRDLARFYRVSDAMREELLSAAAAARKTGWWEDFGAIDEQTSNYIAMESAASSIRTVETRVPGLLQTSDFTRALLESLRPPGELTPEWIEDTIAARAKRQERLDAGLELQVVIDEAAFARPLGGPGLMRGQVERLIRDAARPNVSIQVVPFERGPHPGIDGNFNYLNFPSRQLEDLVYVEGLLGNFLLNRPRIVAHYLEVFDYLRNSVALPPDQSVGWLEARLESVPAQKGAGSRRKGS
jgi:transcriptional regulator with XRE-family HTH domain